MEGALSAALLYFYKPIPGYGQSKHVVFHVEQSVEKIALRRIRQSHDMYIDKS